MLNSKNSYKLKESNFILSVWNTFKVELKDAKHLKNPFVSLGLNTVFEQNKIAENETSTPAYALINATIGGDLMVGKQALKFTVGVTNLLDQQYVNHLSRLKQNGIYNMGRNIVFGLKIPFQYKKS